MEKKRLTRKFIDGLKPRKKEYVVRDREVPGLGVRVYASGRKMFFAQMQIQGRRKQQSLGTLDQCSLTKARELALACTADGAGMVPTLPDALFEKAAVRVLENYQRNWKPTTAKASYYAYEKDVLPFFEGMKIGEIERSHVVRWFASLGNRPGAANRAMPVLSVIMQQAGHSFPFCIVVLWLLCDLPCTRRRHSFPFCIVVLW